MRKTDHRRERLYWRNRTRHNQARKSHVYDPLKQLTGPVMLTL